MSQLKDFTLQQLAQIALGGTSLDNINISLLHTIINFALKKLDCENEKVVISGLPAENIQKLLQTSTTGPALQLDENAIQAPMKKYTNITKLEEKVRIIEDNLNQHLSEFNFRKTLGTHIISEPCQTDCELEEQKDEIIIALFKNDFLLNQLMEYLSKPLKCRMNVLQIKLNELSNDFEDFKKKVSDASKKMDKVEDLSMKLQSLHNEIKVVNLDFDITILEIQENMDLKVNNCDIIPFKIFFKNQFDELNKKVEDAIDKKTKLRALICDIKPVTKSPVVQYKEKKESESQCECEDGRNIIHVAVSQRSRRISTETISRQSNLYVDVGHRFSLKET